MEQAQEIADPVASFPIWTFLAALFASAVWAWGATETLKRVFLNRWKMRQPPEELRKLGTESAVFRGFEASENGWWLPLLWFLAVVLGFSCGAFIGTLCDWGWQWGGLTGGIGGALSAFLVALFKSQAKRVANAAVGSVLRKVGLEAEEGK